MTHLTFNFPNPATPTGDTVNAGGAVVVDTADEPLGPTWVQCRLVSHHGDVNLVLNDIDVKSNTWSVTFRNVTHNENEAELVALLYKGATLLHAMTRRFSFA